MKKLIKLSACMVVVLGLVAGVFGGWWSTGGKGGLSQAVVDDKARVAYTDDWENRC